MVLSRGVLVRTDWKIGRKSSCLGFGQDLTTLLTQRTKIYFRNLLKDLVFEESSLQINVAHMICLYYQMS